MGKTFRLNKDDQKEGMFKRLQNIEGKNEEQLQAIKYQGKKLLDAIKNTEPTLKSLKAIIFFSI